VGAAAVTVAAGMGGPGGGGRGKAGGAAAVGAGGGAAELKRMIWAARRAVSEGDRQAPRCRVGAYRDTGVGKIRLALAAG
jgi:hypothetical protein